MKKPLLILTLSLFLFDVSAQTKTAYCDVYARGGGKHMKITIMYNNTPYEIYPDGNRSNLGNILNVLASDGWVLDRDIVIPRHPFWSLFTRHKLHFIMKKEYQEGENPFLLFENDRLTDNDEPIITANDLKEKPLDNTIADELEECAICSDDTIIVSKYDNSGTWYDAMEYCKQLGEGWTLPNSEQAKYICNNYDIKFSSCWTNVEVNEKKAKAYYRGYTLPMMSTHKSIDNISIIAVKVVDKEVE